MARRAEAVSFTLETVQGRTNLVATVAEAIEREIGKGKLKPGDRLPPQEALAAKAGVSRTVVREAIASLRAAGLVATRQGAGAFVAFPDVRLPFQGNLEQTTVENILGVLEVRMAVEVETAALAAMRRTDEDIAALDAAIADLSRDRALGKDGVEPDLAFHAALAVATRNPHFTHFLEYLGEFAMPRRHFARAANAISQAAAHLEMIESEHRAIRDAVAAQDASLAAATMRGHIAGSRKRYSLLGKS